MKNNLQSKLALLVAGSALLGSLLVGGTAFAQTTTPPSGTPQNGHWGMGAGHMPGVFGTVSAVNGTTLTVTSKGFGQNATATTYTVDASTATVTKNGAASSLGNVSVGDMVMVQGSVSGTSVTATKINDGMMGRMGMKPGQHATSTPMTSFQGNGEPVVGGTVTAVNGSSLTVTNKSNVTYTIDASSATVQKGNATSSISNVAVGDQVLVQGTVNGNAVVASSVIDQGAPKNSSTTSSGMPKSFGGFVGAIGGFFQHIFGFF